MSKRKFECSNWDFDGEGDAFILAKDECPNVCDVPKFLFDRYHMNWRVMDPEREGGKMKEEECKYFFNNLGIEDAMSFLRMAANTVAVNYHDTNPIEAWHTVQSAFDRLYARMKHDGGIGSAKSTPTDAMIIYMGEWMRWYPKEDMTSTAEFKFRNVEYVITAITNKIGSLKIFLTRKPTGSEKYGYDLQCMLGPDYANKQSHFYRDVEDSAMSATVARCVKHSILELIWESYSDFDEENLVVVVPKFDRNKTFKEDD